MAGAAGYGRHGKQQAYFLHRLGDLPKPGLLARIDIFAGFGFTVVPEIEVIADAAAKTGNVLEKEETRFAADICATGARRLAIFGEPTCFHR